MQELNETELDLVQGGVVTGPDGQGCTRPGGSEPFKLQLASADA
jgi:bacteriocin-like protein